VKTICLIDRKLTPARKTLIEVISSHGARGITVGDMRNCVNIITKLEAADDSVALEDSEYTILLRYFEQYQFSIAHADIVALYDDLKAAK